MPPIANSGTAAPAKKYVQRRSRACSPGAMNAQSWYIQIGRGDQMPMAMASFRCRKK